MQKRPSAQKFKKCLLSDSEKLAVLFVNFPFPYVLCYVGIFVKTFLMYLQLLYP
jgi:hypothetical protein